MVVGRFCSRKGDPAKSERYMTKFPLAESCSSWE